jgi:hypothetical protein
MIPGGGGGWEGCGGCLAYTPPPKKNFGQKMGKFGKKMAFFANFLTNPRDFHKSAVKFHEIF